MMKKFYETHTKGCQLGAIGLGIIIFVIYLYILFLPGYQHGDAFLFKQKDGSFAGAGDYAKYHVTIERTTNNTTITFAVNDMVREYQITGTATGEDVYIYEDNERIFHGHSLKIEDSYFLMGDDDSTSSDVVMFAGNLGPDTDELFPANGWLYNVACSDKMTTFGNPIMLLLIFLLIVILALDIKYPKMFFYLRYSHMVNGGEPSEWYYTSQMIGRIITVILIPVCMWISLFKH